MKNQIHKKFDFNIYYIKMLSQSVLIEQIKKRCFEKDKINGDIKFRFILN